MLDRLNFFDVYAYLLPGTTWLALVSLPYFVFTGCWPSEALLSALASIIGGYILGHVLYQASREACLLRVQRLGRYDSQILLDDADTRLSDPTKARLRSRAKELFGVELTGASDTDAARQDVFLMARALLNVRKEAFYAEQFQGMYTLSRGLAGACFLAGISYLGWGTWGLLRQDARSVKLAVGLLAVFLVAVVARSSWRSSGWFAFLLVAMGVVGGSLAWMSGCTNWTMLVVGGSTIALGCMFLPAQKRFQVEFAKAIYYGFAVTEPRGTATARSS